MGCLNLLELVLWLSFTLNLMDMNRKNLLRMATLLVVVLLQLPALLVAGPVSEQRARSVAQMFVRQLPASRAGSWSLKLVYDGSSASRADGG